jgi:hypothetical protein
VDWCIICERYVLSCNIFKLNLDALLITSQNWKVYDPVRQTGSLILDGQTLENLEIFTASVEGLANRSNAQVDLSLTFLTTVSRHSGSVYSSSGSAILYKTLALSIRDWMSLMSSIEWVI